MRHKKIPITDFYERNCIINIYRAFKKGINICLITL